MNRLLQLGFFVYLLSGLSTLISWAYRLFMFQWLYWLDTVIAPCATYKELAGRLGRLKYRADGLWELYNASASPHFVQAVLDGEAKTGMEIGDCEEFALYACAVIKESLTSFTDVEHVSLLTCLYQRHDGTYGAHNVCCLKRRKDWAYVDYGLPVTGDTLRALTQKIANGKRPGESRVLGWVRSHPSTLIPFDYGL